MKKASIINGKEIQNSFFKIKSYSISEVMTAGGTTAFAHQKGETLENIATQLKGLPQDAFLTDDEAKSALEILKNNK